MLLLKKYIKKIIRKACKLSSLFLLRIYYSLLIKCNIILKEYEDISLFKVKTWHLGSRYFLARYHGDEVFIKIDKKYNERITNEIKILNILNSANNNNYFTNIKDFKISDDLSYLAINYINGHTLKECINKNLLNTNDKNIIYSQLLDILKILKKNHIVHRDIRPDNIMVNYKGDYPQIKLIDFAFAIKKNNDGFNELKSFSDNHNLLSCLGGNYKPADFKWDDAYSVYKILDEMYIDFREKYNEKYNKIISLTENFYYKKVNL